MIEMALLFGLGLMGVVLSNLLAGEGSAATHGIATLPRAGREVMEEDEPPEAAVGEEPGAPPPVDLGVGIDGVGIDAPDHRPRLWGHPAPLARLIALIAVSSSLLSSVIWGVGWLLVRTVTRSLAGG